MGSLQTDSIMSCSLLFSFNAIPTKKKRKEESLPNSAKYKIKKESPKVIQHNFFFFLYRCSVLVQCVDKYNNTTV